MGTGTALAVAAITATVAGAGSTAYSAQQARKERKEAKSQQREAQRIQKEQEEQALTARKEMIDQQREGLFNRYKTKTTETPQASSLTGRLGEDVLG